MRVLPAYDFESSVGYWVVLTSHQFVKALNEELAPCRITVRQWQVLAWLAHDGPSTQAHLADRMDLEPATLVSVLGRMERAGWIQRQDCSTDRRKRLISPTRAAIPVWQEGVAAAVRVRARATRGFTPAQRTLVRQLLRKMRLNLMAEAPAAARKESLQSAR